jgi:hypothetical protein
MIEIEWRIPPSYLTCHYSMDNIENKSFNIQDDKREKVKRVQATYEQGMLPLLPPFGSYLWQVGEL